MNSRMNFGEGFSIPQEKDFNFLGSWVPVTPEKPIPTRSNPIQVDRHGNQMGRMNLQQMPGFPGGGYAQEILNYNRTVQNFNPIEQASQNGGGYYNSSAGLTERNRLINQIAGSYTQTICSESAGWNNNNPLANLLERKDAAPLATVNRTPSSYMSMASRPLIPNLHSQVDNWKEFASCNLLLPNQTHCSDSSLLSNGEGSHQIPQNGFPIPSRPFYNLNSSLRNFDATSSGTSSIPFTPVTTDQSKTLENNQFSVALNFSADDSQEKENQDNLVATIGNEATLHNCNELLQNIVESSAVNSTPSKEQKDSDRLNDLGIDLNKTPQQKQPKRRKHRPKVIVEGKPKRTPKPATPKNSDSKENPSGKRKYVRKKSLKESEIQQTDLMKEITDPSAETAAKSCRRSLNFDLEKTGHGRQGKMVSQQDMQQKNMMAFNLNSDSQATELWTGPNSGCGEKQAVEIGQQSGLPVGNQQPGTVSSYTSSLNQMKTDYILPVRRAAESSQAPGEDLQMEILNIVARKLNKSNDDSCPKSSKNGYRPIQQNIHAGIGQIDFQVGNNCESLDRTRQLMSQSTPQQLLKILPNPNETRGSKRAYYHAIEQMPQFTPMCSSLCQEIFQMNECGKNSSKPGAGYSEAHKKKKIENGLHTNTYGMPSRIAAVEDGLVQAITKGGIDVNANGFASPRNHGTYVSNKSVDISRRENSKVDGSTGDPYVHHKAYWHNFPKQHISYEPNSYTQRNVETNGLTHVHNHYSDEKCNLIPPTLPRKAPALGDGLVVCLANASEKQTVKPTQSKSVSSGRGQVLGEQNKPQHEYQQSSGKTRGLSVKQKYPNPIDEIIDRLKGLSLNDERSNHIEGQQQNALVLYKGDGALVPYDGIEFIKRRKPRPKVDLDPETNRIWNLLMGKKGSEGDQGLDMGKEQWWEEQRRVFRGRADSFIARMHLVQGDRRFSKWKGSVVDSVIGVFLTQNVSDHLSSSAFMSLAARFPLKSKCDRTDGRDATNILVEEPEVCVLNPNDALRWHEKVLQHPTDKQSYVTANESKEHQRDSENSEIERTSLVETYTQSLEEEVLSSQDSFDSSIVQANGGIKSYSSSNSEAEYPTAGCKPNNIHGSTKVPHMCNATMFEEFYSHVNGSPLLHRGSKHGQMQSENVENGQQKPRTDRIDNYKISSAFTQLANFNTAQMQVRAIPSSDYQLYMTSEPQTLEIEGFGMFSEERVYSLPSIASGVDRGKDTNDLHKRIRQTADGIGKATALQNGTQSSQDRQTMGSYALSSPHLMHQENISQPGSCIRYDQLCENQHEMNKTFQWQSPSVKKVVNPVETLARRQSSTMEHTPGAPNLTKRILDAEERINMVNKHIRVENKSDESNSREQDRSTVKAYNETNISILGAKKGKVEDDKRNLIEWDSLRKQAQGNGRTKERSKDTMDSLDYEAVRCADVNEISNTIKERGMNNMLAERIKDFLNRIVRDHGSIDLEWLRDVPPEKAKDYLLSVRGLGLKSVECVRLLTLHHLAFPVDTNVGRIAVRLGWVPLQPLPESLQLHLLELYPILESIQKYLWPRLCKLDQRTLYELHYQMITFGKVFCTKSKPNCNACPMRGECRHFASAFASARLALPGPEEKGITSATSPIAVEIGPTTVINPMQLSPPEKKFLREGSDVGKCIPIIEEPATPDQEHTEVSESDIEDAFYEDPDEIPTIKLNLEEFSVNLQNYMQENMQLQEGDMSKALVALNTQAASLPTPKLKNTSRLRTEHQVYELPDFHPLLKGMNRREPDDPSPYLLAIWSPGETANSVQPPEQRCGLQEPGKLCNDKTCFSCNSIREANSQTVRGTLLIPCRTAMRGSFPLNGTYFQVNEVFADHESSLNPIDVPREWIWNLPRRIVYFGTSVTTIFKGLSTEGIQFCFWKGFVCVRGFDQKTRAPRPLKARLHFPASKSSKTKNGSEK